MDFWLFCLISISLIFVSLLLIFTRIWLNPLKVLPGLPLLDPFFGSFSDFVLVRDCQCLEAFKLHRSKYGMIRRTYVMFGGMRLDIADPVWIKHVMVTNSKNYRRGNFNGAEHIFMVVGETGLIVVNGDLHKRLRKLASPAFKPSTLKKVVPYVEMCGQRMVDLIKRACREGCHDIDDSRVTGGSIYMRDILTKTTMDIIGLIAFNYDFQETCNFGSKNTFGSKLSEWLRFRINPSLIIPCQKRMNSTIMKLARYLPEWAFTNFHTGNRIHDLIDEIIDRKIQLRNDEKSKNSVENSNFSNNNNRGSLLEFILDESTNLNRTELHDMVMTFLVAGHETSSVTMTWTLLMLAKHPEHQNKCRQEAERLFEEKRYPNTIEWDDVKKLTYINAVISETLRLYPTVPYLNRATLEADEIGGFEIPANQDILLLIADMQRNPDYWSNPDEFCPDRFLNEDVDIRGKTEAYMPFGEGTHKCIGYQLALIEVAYLIAVLLAKFQFSIDPTVGYREFALVTMKPKPELKLNIKFI